MVDDPDPVGQDVGLLEILSGEEHGHALIMGQSRHLLPQRRPALHVETGGRLIEEQDSRGMHERQSKVQPALHPARVAADAPVGRLGQTDPLEQRLGATPPLGAREALKGRLEDEMFTPGEDRVEGGLLQRCADRGPHLRTLADDVIPTDGRSSARWRQQRRQHQYRR